MEIGTDTHTNNPLDLARSRVPVPLAKSIDRNERDAPCRLFLSPFLKSFSQMFFLWKDFRKWT
jgi:hypothetical protein